MVKTEQITITGWLVPPLAGTRKAETSRSKSQKSGKSDRDMFRYFSNGVAMLQGRVLGQDARKAMTFDTNTSIERLCNPDPIVTSEGAQTILSTQRIISTLLPSVSDEQLPPKTLTVVERVILRRALIALVKTAIKGEKAEHQERVKKLSLKKGKKEPKKEPKKS
eukprot:TRINITY_DN14358_c0_g1_i1.p1 TRINITY_DN14358_c0_g1~~TRINITY_DN14358_c0_g1_i1.p1  ORF type:complete len:165 (+),score=36.93 TRINITY_DN14358_c0_g1_i1:229-723(+)